MPVELTSTAFGCRVGLRAESVQAVAGLLPFWWDDIALEEPDHVVTLGADAAAGIGELELWVAEHAPDFTFVHAGVVAVDGAAILLPGRSLSGKSTLVAALLRAGAQYASDEYAVIDADGMVHPYPRPLSLRQADGSTTRVLAGALGAETVSVPIPVALVAAVTFLPAASRTPDAQWQPTPLTRAEAILRLLDNTVCAATRPQHALGMLEAACARTRAVGGVRGEARAAAQPLLALAATGR